MKILLATDGSRYSGEAVRLLRSLASDRSYQVDLVAVVPETGADAGAGAGSGRSSVTGSVTGSEARVFTPDASSAAPPPARPRIEDQVSDKVASGWLHKAAAELEAVGIDVSTEIVRGVPEEALVERCRTGTYDLIVAGVKGRGAAPFFEVGRVARHLLQWAPVSVLLVRPRAVRSRDAAPRSSSESAGFRVLLPTDGNPGSLEASWRMLDSLTPSGTGIEVVRVVEPSHARTAIPAGEATWSGGSGEAREPARRWSSSDPEGPAGPGRRAARQEGTILRGRPAAAIARWASWNHSDLVVLGLRKPDGADPCLLGPTARELTWSSPCSVLMVRS
ncbi:MAG: universal stress protein [Gemmatimonadales bacterium]|nr:MAG: universal stress protein [Gemmatimonadales bacterium]